ncbi:MAG: hypothetical protein WBI17_08035 [Clostridiaceae bacterium]
MKKTLLKVPVILLLMIMLFPSVIAKAEMPEISGSSALSFDLDTGELILTKDIDTPRYPASITKLLTALVFSDVYSTKKSEYLKYPQEARLEVPYSIYYNLKNIPNDTEISANDVMYALLLGSANDAAVIIAMNISGSIEDFAVLMNKKAQSLGMTNSHFVTATGIHDPDHYTTAYDLTFLLKAAYNDPWLQEVASKADYDMKSKTQTLGTIISKNKNIGLNGNVFGKTGFTGEAGRCLASVYVRDGRTIGTIILNSDPNGDPGNVRVFTDTETLANASYLEEKAVKLSKAQEVGVITVEYRPFRFIGPTREMEVPVKSMDSLSYYENDVNISESTVEFNYADIDALSIKEGTEVGTAVLKERQITKNVSLVSTIDVPNKILKTHLFSYIMIVLLFIVIFMLVLVTSLNKRRRKLARKRRIASGKRTGKYVDTRSKKY